MKEEFKPIKGYEDVYEISNKGKVINRKTKRELKFDNSKGYERVTLSKNGITKKYFVHRLVAIEFIDNTNSKPFINHINGIKNDNTIENLEWCTSSENEFHSFRVLGKKKPQAWLGKFGKEHKSSIPIIQFDLSGNKVAEYNGGMEAQRITGINSKHISCVCKGKRKTTGGYIWRYKWN